MGVIKNGMSKLNHLSLLAVTGIMASTPMQMLAANDKAINLSGQAGRSDGAAGIDKAVTGIESGVGTISFVIVLLFTLVGVVALGGGIYSTFIKKDRQNQEGGTDYKNGIMMMAGGLALLAFGAIIRQLIAS